MTPFAELLRRYRKRSELNQQELARLIQIDQGYLSAMETGAKRNPSDDIVFSLVKAFDLNEEEEKTLNHLRQLSSQTIVPPVTASLEELELIAEVAQSLGGLTKEAVAALRTTLAALNYRKTKEHHKMST